MQVVGVIARASGMPSWADSFALILLVVGFPIALIIAWAFELTPEGPKRTEARAGDETIKPFRLADGVIVAALVVVMGVVVWQQLAPNTATVVMQTPTDNVVGPEAASIAVLAFEDLSPEGDQEYFSDGISEELLNVLVRVEGLRVASRTSAFQFKGSSIGIPAIADQLNVAHVVEGSVRRAGDTIRITAQLIDASTDEHLWSDTFDRTLTASNIFEVQDEIATAIVAALSERLQGVLPAMEIEVEATTENLTAYELYLQARPLFLARDAFDRADALLAQAVGLDPDFSEAWEMRGALHMLATSYGFIDAEEGELNRLAIEYSQRALAIDPESSLAIAVIANVEDDMVEVSTAASIHRELESYDRALEIDPRNTSALNWRGLTLASVGFVELALEDFARCVEIEPDYSPCHANLVFHSTAVGDDQTAFDYYLAAANSGIAVPALPLSMLARLGKRELFLIVAAEEYGPNAPWADNEMLYEIFRDPGGDWDHLIDAITAFEETRTGASGQTSIDIMIGNYDRYDPDWGIPLGPELAGYRQTDAFQRVLEANGLAEYWRTYGFPPRCREGQAGRIDCD